MNKLWLAAAAAFFMISTAQAWEVEAVNKAINETNFMVNGGCSGTLVSLEQNHILTAEHCVDALTIMVEEDEVQPDGTVEKKRRYYRKPLEVAQSTYNDDGDIVGTVTYRATIVGTDKKTDLALLKVGAKLPNTYASPILPADRKIQRGEVAWIVGNPMGLEATVTRGIVSHLRRELKGASGYENDVKFTQIDAGASPGNSGGAIYNDEGQIIGVLVRGYNGQNHLSFGVGIEAIRKFMANPTGVLASPYGGPPERSLNLGAANDPR